MLIGKRKEDVEVEEVKEGRVTAEDYCRQWLRVDRGQCARRGVHTIRCLDLARRRVDEAAKHGVPDLCASKCVFRASTKVVRRSRTLL